MPEINGFISIDKPLIQADAPRPRAIYTSAFVPEQPQLAVVIVEPPAEEKRAAYRMLIRLARALADKQCAVIKFDLSGSGDSTLPHAETTFNAWLEDTVAAAAEIRELAKTDKLAIVGARAGALVAAQAAKLTKAAKLVLAEPIISGADFLRDLERRQSIKVMIGGGENAETAQQKWDQNLTFDFGGFPFNAQLAAQLNQQDLQQIVPTLDGTAVSAIRVSASKRLPPAWGVFGENATIVSDKPFWGQLDYYESDIVNDEIISKLFA